MLRDLLADQSLDPVELPVTITVGDPATGAIPEHIGTVHVALRVDNPHPDGSADTAGAGLRLVPVDPDNVRHQLAALLDHHTTNLRNIVEGQEAVG